MTRSHWQAAALALSALMAPGAAARGQDATQPNPSPTFVFEGARPTSTRFVNQPAGVAGIPAAFQEEADRISLAFQNPGEGLLGMALEPVGDSLRAQLDIPAGQGLLVASLSNDGPASRAGLKANDILLALADKPLAEVADLTAQLKAAGEGPVPLKIIRAGKPETLRIRPVSRVTLGPVGEEKPSYFIGIAANPLDDPLRAHLGLPEGHGLIASGVVQGSPAEKAGVKPHDILLEFGGKLLDSRETLVAQVQAARDKGAPLKLLRAGKPLTVQVTPAPRAAAPESDRQPLVVWTVQGQPNPLWMTNPIANYPLNLSDTTSNLKKYQARVASTLRNDPVAERIRGLEEEIRALHRAVEEVRDALKAKGKGRD